MSLTKNSFNRYDDKLTELLLSYLPISDKIRFEIVSKQWQRLVFNKQKKLIISLCEESLDTILIPKKYWNNKNVIEILLKKFKYINEFQYKNYEISAIFDIIVNNCHYLEKILFFGKVEEKDLIEFGLKCGQNLESININIYGVKDKQLESLLRLTPNLREVYVPKDVKLNEFLDPFLPKLEEIVFNNAFDIKHFESFAAKYQKQIKRLEINHMFNEVNEYLAQISLFENLEELRLSLFNKRDEIQEEFTRIGNKCKRLRRLRVTFRGICTELDLFEMFVAFQALEELSISSSPEFAENIGNIKTLSNCKALRALEFDIPFLNDEHLEGIDLYLPQLRSFSLIGKNHGITDNTLTYLSKLQNLRTVIINTGKITINGICYLVMTSPNIREIQVFNRLFNESLIQAFVEKSKANQEFQYKLISTEGWNGLKRITNSAIPKNLLIKK